MAYEHLMDDSGISYNEDYNLTHHGASLSEDELERFLHCPVCKDCLLYTSDAADE